MNDFSGYVGGWSWHLVHQHPKESIVPVRQGDLNAMAAVGHHAMPSKHIN